MNDNSKADLNETNTPATTNHTWKPIEGDALRGVLFSNRSVPARPGVRVTALAVPATLLAAETSASDDPGLTGVFGVMADAAGVFLQNQPVLTSAMVVGLIGAGYMKYRDGVGGLNGEWDGFANRGELRKHLSRAALVKKRGTLRPSLADVPARKVPTNAVGVYLGRDRKTGLHLYMSIEESSLMIAPMGGGKTAKIANWIIDAEGAVLATSTKFDLVEHTEQMRAKVGRILIWNPQGLAGRESNLVWDPVIGCSDRELGVERCMRRAQYLLEGSDATKGVENRSFWQTSAYSVLKAFLWAADAAGLTLLDVARWSKSVRNHEAIAIFEEFQHPNPHDPSQPVAPHGWHEDLEQVQKVEGKPTTSENVFGTLSKTFMFLDSPRVQQIIKQAHDPATPQFDIPAYLTSRDTLYLLGRDDGMGSVGPLFTCLTGEIYETARGMASLKKGGRLDPPWTQVLDEAALICSVPLAAWTADSRGLGIDIHACFQSPAQIMDRWGKFGYQTIWDNCTKLILGGLSNREHLDDLSGLCGRHKEKKESRSSSPGTDGATRESSSWTKVEVDTMTPQDIHNLPPGQMLILRKHLGGPVVVSYTPVWARKDIQDSEKAAKRAARQQRKDQRRKEKAVPAYAPPAPAPAAPPVEEPADLWAPAQPADPWMPPAPDTDPWTAAPASSGWATVTPLPGQRDVQVVRGEVVPPRPEQPPAVPDRPDFQPTAHLEQVPQQPETPADTPARAEPTQLRKTGTDSGAAKDGWDWDDDDETGF
ncbi:TraM recognition domain-containing protein [Streptomyces sp. BH105]|uniref:type IV secretory system conjugative DNA transfer family protein n=1 Tax=Streptomyces sp. BH105 TaxID=3410408 RepID=UPI003CF587CD